ncbi:unnamed protein product [Phytophthora lilii]|uniref:Unnamed protein product n=1 Tax=Phytophthora lilii TaxID=2077276 RepID=A0A9W6WQW5_9STRA|nr:unnamed protein product [Phytophthora lilii]
MINMYRQDGTCTSATWEAALKKFVKSLMLVYVFCISMRVSNYGEFGYGSSPMVVDVFSDDVEHAPLVLPHVSVPHAARERHFLAGDAAGYEVVLSELDRDIDWRLGEDVAHATHTEAEK